MPDPPQVDIAADAGAIAARRIIKRLGEVERSGAHVAAAE
jgi:hypothetical protein